MEKAKFTVGCFVFIFDEQQRVLMCHRRDKDLWNLPGGGLESGEAPWEGAIREAKEETGLVVEITKLADVSAKTGKDELVFSFLCKVIGGEITLNEEADKIEYFATDKLPANMSLKQRERMMEVVSKKEFPIFRIQNGKSSDDVLKELRKR